MNELVAGIDWCEYTQVNCNDEENMDLSTVLCRQVSGTWSVGKMLMPRLKGEGSLTDNW
ncbi:MAG: hypothetical protein ACLUEJ_15245 [Clostridium sp.]